jgi:ribosome maturation factor RimP
MGYEMVGVEYLSDSPGGAVLRVYIDQEAGVQLDDCTKVSHQLSGVLDVEDPIRGEYNLEVSSPGLDRPLFEKAHFERFVGHQVKIRLARSHEGRRRFKGVIVSVEGDEVTVNVDGEEYVLPFADIDTARLVPVF